MELGPVAIGEGHISSQRHEHKYQNGVHLANPDCRDGSGEVPSLTKWLEDVSVCSHCGWTKAGCGFHSYVPLV